MARRIGDVTAAPKIGVLGAPDVATALSSLGFDVITADTFRDAATAISNALKDGAFRLVVADSDETPVIVPWTTVTVDKAERVVVLGTQPGLALLADDHPELRLELPATFNDLLGKLGYASTPAPVGGKLIALDGALVDEILAPEPALAPEPLPLPSAAVVTEQPPLAPTFEAVIEQAPEPVVPEPAIVAPRIVDEPAAAPVFAVPDAVEPAPAVSDNEPEVTPVPVFAGGSAPDAPAAETVTAPVVQTPALPVFEPAPAAEPVFTPAPVFEVPAPVFETPAAAPAEQPLPVFTPAPTLEEPAEEPAVAPALPAFTPPVAEGPALPVFTPPQSDVPAQAPLPVLQPAPVAPQPQPQAEPVLPAFELPADAEDRLGVSDAAVDAIFGSQPAAQTAAPVTPVAPAPAPQQYPSVPLPHATPVTFSGPGHTQPSSAPPAVAPAPRHVAPQQAPSAGMRIGTKRGEVIVCGAGKGGVGKTSATLLCADVAAEMGLQAIVIDANRGQADIRKYLRLGDAPLPSAYDAYATGNPASAVLMPHDYAHLRTAAMLDVPDFGIVLGPPSDFADPRFVSANVYGEIIDYARSIADVVIIDSQIVEAYRSDLWENTLIPMLGGDAWFVAITDESGPGISNLAERLTEMRRAGVNPARTLVLASAFLEFNDGDIAYFHEKFGDLGTLVGSTGVDDDFLMAMNSGRILSDSPSIRPAIDSILLRVTGRADLFGAKSPAAAAAAKPKAGRFSFFGKKKGA